MPQAALTRHRAVNPYRWRPGPQLWVAKVIARHPERGTVDCQLVSSQGGGILRDVPWAAGATTGTTTGQQYLPPGQATAPRPTAGGPYGLPLPGAEDDWVVIGWLHGSGRQPVVLAQLPDPGSQVTPQAAGWAVFRHESGVWHAIDPTGNVTLGFPDGSTIAAGPSGQSANPSADINPQWPSASGAPITVTIRLAGGASLSLHGDQITLNGGTAGVARIGDPVQVTINGTTYTGQITGGSSTVTSG